MAKGTVTSHISDCEYEIQLKYNRETFDRRIQQLTDKITTIEDSITEIEEALDYGGF